MLADFLQGESIDMGAAIIAIESTLDTLKRVRASKEIDDEIKAAVLVTRAHGIDPEAEFKWLHRVRRCVDHRGD